MLSILIGGHEKRDMKKSPKTVTVSFDSTGGRTSNPRTGYLNIVIERGMNEKLWKEVIKGGQCFVNEWGTRLISTDGGPFGVKKGERSGKERLLSDGKPTKEEQKALLLSSLYRHNYTRSVKVAIRGGKSKRQVRKPEAC